MTDQNRVERFVKLLKFEPIPDQSKLKDSLDKLKSEDIVPKLLEILISTDNLTTKQEAIRSLEYISGKDSIRPLLDIALNDNDQELRKTAIRTLAYLKDETSLATLNKIVNRSSDPEIIQLASQSVQVIQGIAPAYTVSDV